MPSKMKKESFILHWKKTPLFLSLYIHKPMKHLTSPLSLSFKEYFLSLPSFSIHSKKIFRERMETKPLSTAPPRTYEDFQPRSDWVREEKADTVVLHLPGFKKEHLRVQVDSNSYVKVSGERLIDGTSNKWSSFRKEFRAPNDCNLSGISAKFENATLYLIMPKDTSDTLPIGDQPKATTALKRKKQRGSGFLPGTSEATSGSSRWFRIGGGLMSGKRVLVVSVMVVVVAVGVYAAYKHLSPEENED